jgi:PAS domain S-box-containing protein
MNDGQETGDHVPSDLERLRRCVSELEQREGEHRRTANALVQSEEKFRRLTEKAVVGVYLIQDGTFQYANPKLADIFGYDVEELVPAKGPQDLTFPDDWPMVDKSVHRRISGDVEGVHQEFRGVRKDGEVIRVEVYGARTAYRDRPAIIGTLVDVTAQFHARKALEADLNKFQALYDLALAMTAERSLDEDLNLIVEKSRILLGADKAFMALRDEAAGDLYMHAFSGIVTEEFKKLRIPIGVGLGGKVAETGRLYVVEDYLKEVGPVFQDVASAEGLFSGVAVPVNIGDANLGVLYVFNRTRTPFSRSDIDNLSLLGNLAAVEISRRRAEERLRESQTRYRALYEESKRREDLYRSLLNSSADAIVIYDMEGRTQYVNPSFTHIFGWSMEEVQNRQIPFLPESERETTMAVIRDLIAKGTPTSAFESKRYTKDGRLVSVSISASRCHDHEGVPAGTLVIIRDISERKRAQESLQESEVRYRNLYDESRRREELYVSVLNSSADAIVIYDMEGRAQYVNPSFTRIFGWTMVDVHGLRIPFVPECELEASMGVIRGIIGNGTTCSGFETTRYTKDGRTLNISISASRYHDNEGNPAGIVAILRDVTDRKRAEAALRESEERFRTLAEVAPFGLAVIGADEKAEYVNPKFTEIFGYTLDDVPDVDSWSLKAYKNKAMRIKAASLWRKEAGEIRALDQTGAEAILRIFTARAKQGGEKVLDFRSVVLPDGRVITTFLDITEQAKAQEEIIRAKDQWERTFNAVSDLILILDGQGRIVAANRALAERLAVSPDEIVGLNCRETTGSLSPAAALCPKVTSLDAVPEYAGEVTDENLGGVFDLRVSPLLDESGAVFGSVHTARDVTAIKAMEHARKRAVHHLSHELKTPLVIMKASLKNLGDRDLSPAAREANLERIRRNLKRLEEIQQIVQEIVEPREHHPGHFPLVPAVERILADIRARCAHRDVRIVPSLEEIETDVIDPEILDRVLRTIVKNAVENTPDGGEVIVCLKAHPSGALLLVEDRGVGLTPTDRKFAFEGFHHTQETDHYATKNPYDFDAGGKGLELMRLKILAEDGYFDISCESRRCRYLAGTAEACPGAMSRCRHVTDEEDCVTSGGAVFSVIFHVCSTLRPG